MKGCHPGRWWWGLPVLAMLWAGTAWLVVPHVEADRARREAAQQSPPAALSLRRDGQRLALRGRIGAEPRKAIETELRRAGFTGEIADESDAPSDAPPPVLGADLLAAIRALARLPEGEARIGPEGLSLRGRAAEFETYNEIREAMRGLNGGAGIAAFDLTPPVAEPFVWMAERSSVGLDLSGYVPSEPGRAGLLGEAAAMFAGLPVGDRMQTASGAPPALVFGDGARFALEQLARLDRGRVALQGSVLSIEGAAQDRDALGLIGETMRKVLPGGLVAGGVTLTALPVSPYPFMARRGQGLLTLSGYAPDEETRRRILGAARRSFLTEQIADQLRLGDGAPPGFLTGVSFALDHLARLASGEARISGQAIGISGESLYRQSGEQTRRRILAEAPAGWTSAAEITINSRDRVLDAEFCQDLLGEAREKAPIQFEAKATALTPEARQRVLSVAALLKRCGASQIAVAIEPEPGEEPALPLASGRVQTVVAALVGAGLAPDRLRAAPAAAGPEAARTAPPAVTFTVER